MKPVDPIQLIDESQRCMFLSGAVGSSNFNFASMSERDRLLISQSLFVMGQINLEIAKADQPVAAKSEMPIAPKLDTVKVRKRFFRLPRYWLPLAGFVSAIWLWQLGTVLIRSVVH